MPDPLDPLGTLPDRIRDRLKGLVDDPDTADALLGTLLGRLTDPRSGWRQFLPMHQQEYASIPIFHEYTINQLAHADAGRGGFVVLAHWGGSPGEPDIAHAVRSMVVRLEEIRPGPGLVHERPGDPPGTPSPEDEAARDRRAELRLQHAGRWVAWTPDLSDIMLSSTDPLELRRRGQETGIAGLVYEWVPPVRA